MGLLDQLRILRRHWQWVIGFTVLGLVVGAVWILVAPRSDRATAELYVAAAVPKAPTGTSVDSASKYVLTRMPSYAGLVDSVGVTSTVIGQLGLSTGERGFRDNVAAYVPAKSTIIQVSFVAANASTASSIANATAARLGRAIEESESPPAGGLPLVKATVSSPATPRDAIVSPSVRTSLLVGGIGGLLIGLLAATAREQAGLQR